MGRAVFQHEMQDSDFAWLVSRFQEQNPSYLLLDSAFLPLVLIKSESSTSGVYAGLPPSANDTSDASEERELK